MSDDIRARTMSELLKTFASTKPTKSEGEGDGSNVLVFERGRSDVLVINMQSRPLEMLGRHVHTCPTCYEHIPCAELCAVEPDLALDDGTLRGHYVTCDDCQRRMKRCEVEGE